MLLCMKQYFMPSTIRMTTIYFRRLNEKIPKEIYMFCIKYDY